MIPKPEPCKVCGGPVEETEDDGVCFTCNTINGSEVEEWAHINEPMDELE